MDKKSLSNDQRLKSIHQRKENQLKSKNYIQEALSQSNVNKKSLNHIKFDSSDEDESENDGENNQLQAPPKTRGGDDILGFNDSGSDDDELVINEQYEGESGSKLLSMQSKIGTNDSRFKLDARFISDKDANAEEDKEEPMEMEASEDKKRNLSVLNSVLFSQGISNLPKKRVLQFHDPSKKRYDPTNVEHKDMVVEGPKKKKKKRKVETPAPEVDKSRFYEADVGTLRNVFQKSNQDEEEENNESKKESAPPVFSFLSQFGSNSDLEEEEEEEEIKKETDLPTRHKPVMTSSDDETSEEEEVEDKEEKTKPAMVTPTPRNNEIPPPQEQLTPTTLFMTSSKDPRITCGPLKFCWNKSKDEIRADWEELQDFLRTDYRRKHRMAKKVEKHQNKREKEQLIFGPGAVEIS